ncbi:MAG: hypothetical protein ACRDTZ_06355 [Pseudonocardiaceae bacterium]
MLDIFEDTGTYTPPGLPGFELDARVEGARITEGLKPSRGTMLDGQLLSDEDTDDFWSSQRSGPDTDGFSAAMHAPDVAGLTNANAGLAPDLLSSVKNATDDIFSGRGDVPPEQLRAPKGAEFRNEELARMAHMALEKGVEASVFSWAARTPSGSMPSVDPDDEIWSSPIGGIMSHQAVQAEQAAGLISGGQGWFNRVMEGDIYDSAWSDPDRGIYSHEDILREQAQALSRGYQNPLKRIMEGDVFAGYRDDVSGDINYSKEDAREVSQLMSMWNLSRTRHGGVGQLFSANVQPGSGFNVDDNNSEGVWSDMHGVQTRGDVMGMSPAGRLMSRFI